MTTLLVLIVCIAVVIFWGISIFNRLVALKGQYQNSFAQIDVQLKRRYDLIPNLVESVKGYLSHESGTLIAVTEARNAAMASLKAAKEQTNNPQVMQQLADAEKQLSTALQGLQIQIEAYPELKANENILQLQEEITSTENKVAFARQAYNDSVTSYNVYRQQFPNNLIANRYGHTKDAVLLEIENPQEYRQTPKISF